MDHQDLINSAVIAHVGSDEQASATPTSDWGGLSEGVLQLVSSPQHGCLTGLDRDGRFQG